MVMDVVVPLSTRRILFELRFVIIFHLCLLVLDICHWKGYRIIAFLILPSNL